MAQTASRFLGSAMGLDRNKSLFVSRYLRLFRASAAPHTIRFNGRHPPKPLPSLPSTVRHLFWTDVVAVCGTCTQPAAVAMPKAAIRDAVERAHLPMAQSVTTSIDLAALRGPRGTPTELRTIQDGPCRLRYRTEPEVLTRWAGLGELRIAVAGGDSRVRPEVGSGHGRRRREELELARATWPGLPRRAELDSLLLA